MFTITAAFSGALVEQTALITKVEEDLSDLKNYVDGKMENSHKTINESIETSHEAINEMIESAVAKLLNETQEEREGTLPKFGVLTSPNYPESYPSSHDSTQEIHVAEGKTIEMRFTDFNTERKYDYVEIKDGDGTSLLPKESGSWEGPELIVSKTNEALVKFHTDKDTQKKGWRLEWSEHKI